MSAGSAIILAAGEGRRMGADKALLDLGGRSLLDRVLDDCRLGGFERIVVVRAEGAADVALSKDVRLVKVPAGGEMVDSVRAGLRAAEGDRPDYVLHFPVDYALAGAGTVALIARHLENGSKIVLPIAQDKPGHPIGFSRAVCDEILDPATQTLRDVVRKDKARVAAVPVTNPWVLRDLDTPIDLRAARAFLRSGVLSPVEQMRAHRSRRAFHPDPIPDEQLEHLIDSSRYAPTSSFIQAYTVVAVTDPERKAAAARLCADYKHIHEAPVFLAICADLHKIHLACKHQDTELRAGSVELFLQSCVDAALVGQNLQLAAESEGLGSCMIGAARNHPVELAQLLELPPHCFVLFGMVLGNPADDPVPRGRMPLPAVLHTETYRTEGMAELLDAADEGMREWARRTNQEQAGYGGKPVNEERGWRERTAWRWGRDRPLRNRLVDELRQLGFDLDDVGQ